MLRRCFLLGEELLLIATLHDVGENEDGDHEVEGGLGHRYDFVAADVKMGEMAAFGEEHNANDEENEESEHFIHAVFLQEGGDLVSEPNHEDSTDDDGDDDQAHPLLASGLVFRESHCGEDGVEGEDHVHGHNQGNGLCHRGRLLVAMTEVVGAQHVEDLLQRGIKDKDPSEEHDDGVEVEVARDDTRDFLLLA